MKRSALRRVAPMRTVKLAGTRRDTGPSANMRALVLHRAENRCERCAGPLDAWFGFSVHHRLPRSRGGLNTAPNLLVLCGSGVTGCHGWVETNRTAAYLCQLLLRTEQDPASEPVHLHDGWVYLAPDGKAHRA